MSGSLHEQIAELRAALGTLLGRMAALEEAMKAMVSAKNPVEPPSPPEPDRGSGSRRS